MDAPTIEAYNCHAEALSERYRGRQRVSVEQLKVAFGYRSRILDVGAGSGADMAHLLDAGYDVMGLEPSEALRQSACQHFPRVQGRLFAGGLPLDSELAQRWRHRFSGILCCAVLMHIPPTLQLTALQDLYDLLSNQGRLLLVTSGDREGLDTQRRDAMGRLYTALPEKRVEELARQADFRLLEVMHDEDQWNRRGLDWASFLLEK